MKDSESKAPDPFRRFEDLTERLLSVPKKEAGAKTAERKQENNKTR